MPQDDLNNASTVKRALIELRRLKGRIEQLERAAHEPVAIIGIGCRFPGSIGPAEFWSLLREGRDAIREVPAERWDIDAYHDPEPGRPGKMATRWGGFLEGVDAFDPGFFGMTPREAMNVDPQQRLLLEVTWEALEDAGAAPDRLRGSATGVFIGIGTQDYLQMRMRTGRASDFDAYLAVGCASHSVASGRLAYFYGLNGPCLSVDTACSSSLVATHLACQSLRNDECGMALAGGVNLTLSPENTLSLSNAGMMAADGRCKTFDQSADGFVRAEGCGIVVLKRLAAALADGDRIYAVIRGSAVNQDGRSNGLTAPSGPAQEAVIRAALRSAGVDALSVQYVEAHGTGTALGDPIEVRALSAVYCEGRRRERPLILGSVKTNIGHGEGAAGIAGLIKVALALDHGQIPAHLHFRRPTPHIPWAELPLDVPITTRIWPSAEPGKRLAGLSSFGFSGTNAHLILEEAPPVPISSAPEKRRVELLVLSAKTPTGLRRQAERLAAHLECHAELPLGDVCHTVNAGRAGMEERLALTSESTTGLVEALRRFTQGEGDESECRRVSSSEAPAVAFLFADTEARTSGNAKDLYLREPEFRAAFDACVKAVANRTQPLSRIFEDSLPLGLAADLEFAGAATFAVEWALARMWQGWGLEPDAVAGNGTGEFTAGAIAGLFDLEQAMDLALHRGRLMQAVSRQESNIALLEELRRTVDSLPARPPHIPFISAESGVPIQDHATIPASYWYERAAASSAPEKGLDSLIANGHRVILQIGLSPEGAPGLGGGVPIPTLLGGRSSEACTREALGALYQCGAAIDWKAYSRCHGSRIVSLPTYPWERDHYWFEESGVNEAAWVKAVCAAKSTSAWIPADLALGTYPAKWALLDQLAAGYMSRTLQDLGGFRNAGDRFTSDSLISTMGVVAEQSRLVRRWLEDLVGAGMLHRDQTEYEVKRAALVGPMEGALNAAKPTFEDAPLLLDYVARCGRLLPAILTGRESPLETLFPGGQSGTTDFLYRDWAVARYFNGIAAAIARAAADEWHPDRQFRILEVGAGTGGTSHSLLPGLDPERSEYDFTDVSDLFLAEARKKFIDFPFVRYRRLDIEKEPLAQGFRACRYNMVVAANSLHATKDLHASLEHVKELLASGGILVLWEIVEHPRWFNVTTGLIEGWQRFNDGLRQEVPLLPERVWRQLLSDHGFCQIEVFPTETASAAGLGQRILLARLPGGPKGVAARAADWEPSAIRIAPNAAESPPAVPPVKLKTDWLDRLRERPEERRESMIDFVREQVHQVLRFSSSQRVDRKQRLMDLGVDSLMAVELRNNLKQALGLQRGLPATIAFDYPTPEDLADFLLREWAAGAPESTKVVDAPEQETRPARMTVEQLERLSDEEVASMLGQTLSKKSDTSA